MTQKNETFVNASLFILIIVKILQEVDHFAQQQRIKLFNTQTMKRLNIDVFSNVNTNDQFLQRTKINENSEEKNDN